jgi:hypothetical protein
MYDEFSGKMLMQILAQGGFIRLLAGFIDGW